MLRTITRFAAPILALLLFSIAITFLYRELSTFRYQQIISQFRHIPRTAVILSIVGTLLSYFLLTGYDLLGLRSIGIKLGYPKTALASFLGYALSNNLGFSVLTGGAVRFRLLSGWGLDAEKITRLLAFTALVFWLGFLSVGGIALVCNPNLFPPHIVKIPLEVRAVGIASLVIVFTVLYFISRGKGSITIGAWHLPAPPLGLTLAGIALSILDWTLSAGIAYQLVPHGTMPFLKFLGIFQLAQVIGLISHVPGGLGVFEAVMLSAISHRGTPDAIAAGLLAFRLIYYLGPLAIALVSFLIYESLSERGFVNRAIGPVGRGVAALVPQIFAVVVFVLGILLLFSGALPPLERRYTALTILVPLSIIELSHFSASLVGMGLVILAQGLRKRLGAAWYLTSVLLGAGIISSLLKGLDFEEALISFVILGLLLASHKHFYRKTSLVREAFEPRWFLAMLAALVSTTALVFFAYKNVGYSNSLWWQISFSSHASRTLRALVGCLALLGLWGVSQLLKPYRPKPHPPTPEEIAEAQALASVADRSATNLALVGDKALLFSEDRKAVVAYAIQGRCAVAMGDPFGAREAREELVWTFLELCDEQGLYPAFYQAHPDFLASYVDAGLSMIKLGQEALVNLEEFKLEGGSFKSFRQNKARMERDGFTFEIQPKEAVPALLAELAAISDEWLKEKNTREKGFSLGYFDEQYLSRLPIALVRKEDVLVGFANLWSGESKEEFSIDLMRYRSGLHSGIMDYLFTELFLWGKAQGFKRFNLGMAPLSGIDNNELAPLWNKVGRILFRHGEHFYNFQGVLHYKEKFRPEWEPRYLACRGGLRLPIVLADIAALISRGVTGIVTK